MNEFHEKLAAKIINQIIYVTIATVSENGEPWNSPVYCGHDKDLNIYWSSDKEGQHSKNIRANGKVFMVIYDSTAKEGTGEGMYIQANATELGENEEIQTARLVTQKRKGQLAELAEKEYEKFTGDAMRRVYKATPHNIWLNDVELDDKGKYIRDIRVEVQIEKLKELLART